MTSRFFLLAWAMGLLLAGALLAAPPAEAEHGRYPKPGKPLNVSVTERSSSAFYIEWDDPPRDPSIASRRFRVWYDRHDHQIQWTVPDWQLGTGIAGLAPATKYPVRIYTCDSYPTGSNYQPFHTECSDAYELTVSTLPGPPGAPSSVAVTSDGSRVTAVFDEPRTGGVDALSYEIQWTIPGTGDYSADNGTVSEPIAADSNGKVTLTFTGLNAGYNWDFRMRSLNEAGESAWSPEFSLIQDSVPRPPRNLRVEVLDRHTARLTWDPSPDGGRYNLKPQPLKYQYRIENLPGPWTNIPGEGVTSHTVGNLSLHNTIRTFQIRAVNPVGHSWTSGDIVATDYANVPPEPPSNLRVTALGPKTARLEWDASPDSGWADGQPAGNLRYQYRLLNFNGPWVHATIGAETTRDSRGLLLYAARHEWQVRAISDGGVSGASNTAGVGPVPTVPEPPSNLQATIVDRNRVKLTWDASPHGGWINGSSQVPRYQYRIHEPDDAFVEVPGGNVTSYVVEGLDVENNSYRFQLRAVNDHGHSWTTGDIIELGPVDLTAVASIAITSNPGQDSLYAIGDIVRATVFFEENVAVTGVPTLTLDFDGVPKTASYTTGPESDARIVHFSYTVAEGDGDADGVAVPANALSLNGGAITNAASNAAVLAHDAVNAGPAHRVDGVRPTFSSAIVSADGTTVTLSFSEAVTAPPLLLEISKLVNVPVDRFYMAVLDVSAAGRPAPLAGAEISNGQIILRVRSPIGQSQAVTVTYDNIFAENSVGLFIDAAGNPLLNFGPQAAANNSTVNVPTPATDPNDAVVLSLTELTVPEGQNRSYTVRLASQPSTDVNLAIASSFGESKVVDGRYLVNGGLELSASALTFTTDNWNTPQTVTLTAPPPDNNRRGYWVVLVHATESEDSAFDGLWQIVRVVTADND